MADGKSVVRLGLVGIGRIGKIHLQHLVNGNPQVHLVAVCDTHAQKKTKGLNPNIKTYHDYSDMLKNEQISAVVICTPTPFHFDMIAEAFSYGIHVFCEKPLDPEPKNILKLHHFAQKSSLLLQIGFNRRFDHNFQTLKETIQEGDIGDPHIIKITSRDPAPPPLEYLKSSGGLFMDMMIHDFDMARYLIDSNIVEVYAQGSVLIDEVFNQADDIDTAIVQLKFENGTMGVIDNSRQAVYGYDQRIEVFGSKGMTQVDNLSPNHTSIHNNSGQQAKRPYQFFIDRYADSFRQEIDHFVDHINQEQPILVNAYDAYRATQVAIAAQESYKKRKPITISYQ